MIYRLPFNTVVQIVILAIVCFLLAACGGGTDTAAQQESDRISEATGKPSPTQTPAPTATTPAEPDESGLEIRDITLEPGEYGGKLTVTIFNGADEECFGPVVNFELLREDKSVVGRMGIMADPLAPGADTTLTQRYVGIGVAEAAVTNLGCDHVQGRSS